MKTMNKAAFARHQLRVTLRGLQPHQRHAFDFDHEYDGWPSYHTCRFCKHGHAEGLTHLWKYGVRHWICDACKRVKEWEGGPA